MASSSAVTEGAVIDGIVAEGIYILDAPAHYGGEETDEIDMALLRHADGRPYIPGSTVAGVGRATLNARLLGWARFRSDPRREPDAVAHLFGSRAQGGGSGQGNQSALIVDDAEIVDEKGVALKADALPRAFLRDGVAINAVTGIAEDNHKFDMEVLPAGTRFRLRFELTLRHGHTERGQMRRAFLTLLSEFSSREWPLRLGARVNRGYGLGRVHAWHVREADFQKAADAAWWLLDRNPPGAAYQFEPADMLDDQRQWLWLNAEFVVKSSLLVSAYPKTPQEPDKTPVRSGAGAASAPGSGAEAAGEQTPVRSGDAEPRREQAAVPGTALAGVCRHRALRIARALARKEAGAQSLVRALFGPEPEELRRINRSGDTRTPISSRIVFDETLIQDGVEEIQSRIHIDPFTGGVHQGPFDEQAVWSGQTPARVTLDARIRDPEPEEIGLLLQTLKDLWLEDLPVGGGAGIGRGVLCGRNATITLRALRPATETFALRRDGNEPRIGAELNAAIKPLEPEQREQLEQYAKALAGALKRSVSP